MRTDIILDYLGSQKDHKNLYKGGTGDVTTEAEMKWGSHQKAGTVFPGAPRGSVVLSTL